MVSALLVSSSEKGREMLRELMRGVPEISPAVAASGAEARRLAAEVEYDLVVINAPLSDELGDGLSCTLAMDTSAGILLLVRAETADEIAEKVEDVGVMVLGKPLGRAMFYQALKMVAAARRRVLGLKQENRKLQSKIEEIRLVDRAKCHADPIPLHDRVPGAPLHRKAGDGPPRHPRGGRRSILGLYDP